MVSCTPKPVDIEYGEDQCEFCLMTIVNPQFGSELVSNKAKVFKFDAIECMVPFVLDEGEAQFSFILVNDYDHPASLIDLASFRRGCENRLIFTKPWTFKSS